MAEQPPAAEHGAEATAADPSMEDILASIRRILNEEEAVPAPEPAAAGAPALSAGLEGKPVDGDPDILELDASMMLPDADPPSTSHGPVPEPPPVQASDFPRAADSAFAAAPLHDEGEQAITVTTTRVEDDASGEHLVAPAAAAAAANSVGTLVRTLVRERIRAGEPGRPDDRGPGARGDPPGVEGVARHPSPAHGRTPGPRRDRARRRADDVAVLVVLTCARH